MSTIDLCDNCNEPGGTIQARIVLGSDPVILSTDNQVWTKWVCCDCAEALRRLDFPAFEARHAGRSRTLDLP